MLTRAYRLSDRLGTVILKSSAGVGLLLAENLTGVLGTTQKGTRGLLGLLLALLAGLLAVLRVIADVLLRIGRIILRGLTMILNLFTRLTGRTVNVAQSSAGGAMARRAARAEMQTTVAEDPLLRQNRVLSVLIVVVLVALIGVVLWATTRDTSSTSTPVVAGGGINLDLGNGNNNDEGDTGDEVVAAPGDLGFATPVPTATNLPEVLAVRGSIAYVVRENGQTDIWAAPVDSRTRLRLTNSPQDERDPSWSPDGERLAYASNREGNWDLYVLNLLSNETLRLTYNLGFEAAPSWSPDGEYIAYESYQPDTHLDIFVVRADGSEAPIPVASSETPDFAPAWSRDPEGRRIAFTSWQGGNQDIYTFNLDTGDTTNMTNTPNRQEDHAAWSPDGDLLTYSAIETGIEETVYIKAADDPASPEEVFRRGHTPSWSPDGGSIAFAVDTAVDTRITVVPYIETGATSEVIQAPPGSHSPVWTAAPLPTEWVNSGGLELGADGNLFIERVEADTPPYGLAPLLNVDTVEQAVLNDRVNDSFNALRVRANQVIGWDFLGERLSDAFWDLNYRPPPGEDNRNWHKAGRAFAFNRRITTGFPPPIEIVREEGPIDTYWRVFVRVADEAQDGQLGEPLRRMPWVFVTPEDGDVEAYEQGGRLRSEMPEGYYVDLTQLAADYGWRRAPAGTDWRTNFNSRNFWVFQKRDDLTWYEAMLELYAESELGGFVPTATPPPTPLLPPTSDQTGG